MRRRVFDILTSAIGLILVIVLAVAGGLLLWGHNYTHNEVSSQLSAQKIFFPPANSPAIGAPEFAGMHKYAGQQLTTGPQAKVYANDFIANHLKAIGGGQTYAQLSSQLQTDPTNTKLADTVQTMFQGETLRGLLLTSSAFWEIGSIAGLAAIAAFVGAGILLILSVIGLFHSGRVTETKELLPPSHEPAPSGT